MKKAKTSKSDQFEAQMREFITKFPYQDSYDYMVRYTDSDPAKLNTWVLGKEPVLVKAGDDEVVRMNNDTYYKMAFVDLSKGPVTLTSTAQVKDRFSSFQLMDDRNTNYGNVFDPDGTYILYHRGETLPDNDGENIIAIEVPSQISVVIVRVEVKDLNDEDDLESAQSIFNGIDIEGPEIEEFPELDLFKHFDKDVIECGNALLDMVFKEVPYRLTVASPEQLDSGEVPRLFHSAGTKGGWGGPVTSHSSYETIFSGADGNPLDASKGDYSVTFKAPPVDAFWSITVYDTEAGGHLHPNDDNRYHINNTTAVPNESDDTPDEDKTYTFLFKTSCDPSDKNCLEVPAGQFDVSPRYYLPGDEIQSGEWTLPKIERIS